MYKILLFLILLFNVSYAQLFPRSVQYWHLADAVKDSLLARGVADDTTELKSKTFPIDGSIVYLRGLTSGDIVGNGLFYQDNFAYTKDKFNYFDNATGGKQWIRANYRTYVSPTSPSDGLKLIGLGVNRAANIGFYSGDSTRWRIGAEGEADTNNFVIFRYDDDGSFLDKSFEIERSTGTLYLNPDDGDTSNTPVAQRLHSVLESAASSGNNVNSIFRSNQTVANSGNIQGLESYVKVSHPSGTVGLAIAGVSNIEPAMASGRTLSIARSHQAGGNLTGSGTVNWWATYYAQPMAITGGGTIDSAFAFYADNFPSSGATNMYGVYIKDADADNYFAGDITVGDSIHNTALRTEWRNDIGDTSHFISIKDSATFQSFIDGSGFHTLVVEDSFSFQRNDTIPDNLNIIMGRNGMIRNRNGLLTINASFSAGRWKCFESDSGSLIIQNPVPNYVFPEWWGAGNNLSDSLVNDSSFIKAISVCFKTNVTSKLDGIRLSGQYTITRPIILRSYIQFGGENQMWSAEIKASPGFDFTSSFGGSDTTAMIMYYGLSGTINTFSRPWIKNLVVDGSLLTDSRGIWIKVQQASKFENVRVEACRKFYIGLFLNAISTWENTFIVGSDESSSIGILFAASQQVEFTGNTSINHVYTPIKIADFAGSTNPPNSRIFFNNLHTESIGGDVHVDISAAIKGLSITNSSFDVQIGDTAIKINTSNLVSYNLENIVIFGSGSPRIAIYDATKVNDILSISAPSVDNYISKMIFGHKTGQGGTENTYDLYLRNPGSTGTNGRWIGFSSTSAMIRSRSEESGATSRLIIDGGLAGDSLGRFYIHPDGKLEWGSDTTAKDVNLYRAQANTIATDDTLWTKALGIGNSVTNINTPSGATAKAIPIYNSSGALIGYIPVYGSQW